MVKVKKNVFPKTPFKIKAKWFIKHVYILSLVTLNGSSYRKEESLPPHSLSHTQTQTNKESPLELPQDILPK